MQPTKEEGYAFPEPVQTLLHFFSVQGNDGREARLADVSLSCIGGAK